MVFRNPIVECGLERAHLAPLDWRCLPVSFPGQPFDSLQFRPVSTVVARNRGLNYIRLSVSVNTHYITRTLNQQTASAFRSLIGLESCLQEVVGFSRASWFIAASMCRAPSIVWISEWTPHSFNALWQDMLQTRALNHRLCRCRRRMGDPICPQRLRMKRL